MSRNDLLTAKEVARFLRINEYTLYRLVSQKKLPAIKVGSQWRFQRRILEQWLRKNMNIPPAS
jgi:excisionase family DNA binding protein